MKRIFLTLNKVNRNFRIFAVIFTAANYSIIFHIKKFHMIDFKFCALVIKGTARQARTGNPAFFLATCIEFRFISFLIIIFLFILITFFSKDFKCINFLQIIKLNIFLGYRKCPRGTFCG